MSGPLPSPSWPKLQDAGVVLMLTGGMLADSQAWIVPAVLIVAGLALLALAWRYRSMARCRSCRAEIDWVPTVHGKMMPVDRRPWFVVREAADGVPREFWAAVVTDEGHVVRGVVVGQDDSLRGATEIARLVGGTVGRRPHWASCPQAERFRRRQTRKTPAPIAH